MAEDSEAEKTEPASQRRLEQAREEGDVPRSREVATFTVLMAAGAGLWMTGSGLVRELSRSLTSGLSLTREQVYNPDVLISRILVDVVHVLDPAGEMLAKAPYHQESLTCLELDLNELHRTRARLPLLRDERTGLVMREMTRILGKEG